jgi:hypothetical protein
MVVALQSCNGEGEDGICAGRVEVHVKCSSASRILYSCFVPEIENQM